MRTMPFGSLKFPLLAVLALVFAFLVCIPQGVQAETDIGIGAGVNFTGDGDLGTTYYVTANLRWQPHPHFAMEPEVGFWSKTATTSFCFLVCHTETVDFRDLNLGVNVYYVFRSGKVQWSVGGGPSVHFIQGVIGFFGAGSGEETSVGVQVLGGFDFPLTDRSKFFVTTRLDYIDAFNGQVKIYGGIRFRL